MSSGVGREARLCTLRAWTHVYFINISTANRFCISIFTDFKKEKWFVSQVSIFPATNKEVILIGEKQTLAQVRILKELQGWEDVFGGQQYHCKFLNRLWRAGNARDTIIILSCFFMISLNCRYFFIRVTAELGRGRLAGPGVTSQLTGHQTHSHLVAWIWTVGANGSAMQGRAEHTNSSQNSLEPGFKTGTSVLWRSDANRWRAPPTAVISSCDLPVC